MKASRLKKGEKAIISALPKNEAAQRLLEMGFVPGSEIMLTGIGIFGSPMAFRVGLLHAALRKEEAQMIEIKDKEILK